MMNKFKLASSFRPAGDQPRAIAGLTQGIQKKDKYQTLLGVTGSGKTFTLANLIAKVNKPVLVISHNKTLAAQLYSEFKEFFPENAVEYFVSYYDYYQPEAYIPHTDTYIENDASINDDLDRLRLAATSSVLSRQDVIIVSSVSCIYGLGSPEEWRGMLLQIKVNQSIIRDQFLSQLIGIQYERADTDLKRGAFRVRGNVIDLFPSYGEQPYRIYFSGDRISEIKLMDPVGRKEIGTLGKFAIYPAKHFVSSTENIERAMKSIQIELAERVKELVSQGKDLEAKRLESRTRYDLEMLREVGYTAGVENYSRHLAGRAPGSKPDRKSTRLN